jgi:hypothetical protein
LSALTQPVTVSLSAANALRVQLGCVALLALGGVGLKIALARWIGMAGVAWGRVGAELLFLLVPYALLLPPLLRRLHRTAIAQSPPTRASS